jgi:NAD(P)-dependent dehydrogenase (short-subunit alcohol dehydrogenase family)
MAQKSIRQTEWSGATALVTGANKGIGLEIARGLGEMGVTVLLGCRDRARGAQAAEKLHSEGLRAEALTLDVTDSATIQAAAADIAARFGRLDILVNNAGIAPDQDLRPSTVDPAVVRRIYDVNVFGVIAVTQAMLPLLAKSARARIVNLSSLLGSLAAAAKPNAFSSGFARLGYCSSKTALNAITVQFANEFRGSGMKVNCATPGYCSTDMTGHSGSRTARQGAQTPIRLATLPNDGPTACFFDDDGVLAW